MNWPETTFYSLIVICFTVLILQTIQLCAGRDSKNSKRKRSSNLISEEELDTIIENNGLHLFVCRHKGCSVKKKYTLSNCFLFAARIDFSVF